MRVYLAQVPAKGLTDKNKWVSKVVSINRYIHLLSSSFYHQIATLWCIISSFYQKLTFNIRFT